MPNVCLLAGDKEEILHSWKIKEYKHILTKHAVTLAWIARKGGPTTHGLFLRTQFSYVLMSSRFLRSKLRSTRRDRSSQTGPTKESDHRRTFREGHFGKIQDKPHVILALKKKIENIGKLLVLGSKVLSSCKSMVGLLKCLFIRTNVFPPSLLPGA